MTIWEITKPETTDRAVRDFLDRNGEGAQNLSEFVNAAVRRRIFELTVSRIKERNANFDQNEIQALIDEEVRTVSETRF